MICSACEHRRVLELQLGTAGGARLGTPVLDSQNGNRKGPRQDAAPLLKGRF